MHRSVLLYLLLYSRLLKWYQGELMFGKIISKRLLLIKSICGGCGVSVFSKKHYSKLLLRDLKNRSQFISNFSVCGKQFKLFKSQICHCTCCTNQENDKCGYDVIVWQRLKLRLVVVAVVDGFVEETPLLKPLVYPVLFHLAHYVVEQLERTCGTNDFFCVWDWGAVQKWCHLSKGKGGGGNQILW